MVPNRSLTRATLLAGATPRVCHSHPRSALRAVDVGTYSRKGVGTFYQPIWISALGTWSKMLIETLPCQKPESVLCLHSPCSLQLKTLSPGSWICFYVAGSALPASQFFLNATCATGRQIIYFCNYAHARAPQWGGFKLSWRFSKTKSVAPCPSFLQPEPRLLSFRSRRKSSEMLFDLHLWWLLCNQLCCCCSNEAQETKPLKPLELGRWNPKVLIISLIASAPACCSSLDNI